MADPVRELTESSTPQPPGPLWRYAPLVIWLAAIFLASSDGLSGSNTTLIIAPFLRWLFPHISSQSIDVVHLLIRKAAHFSEYAILALLAVRAFSGSSHSFLRQRWFAASLAVIILYALSDEYHQSFVPSRTASIYDSLVDIAGGLTALLLIALWKTSRRKRNRAL
jgi:VanZ family protein